MAGLTIQLGMWTSQWKITLPMLIVHFPAVFPALGIMAVLTIRTKPALMHILVAIEAGAASLLKFQGQVTTPAVGKAVLSA